MHSGDAVPQGGLTGIIQEEESGWEAEEEKDAESVVRVMEVRTAHRKLREESGWEAGEEKGAE